MWEGCPQFHSRKMDRPASFGGRCARLLNWGTDLLAVASAIRSKAEGAADSLDRRYCSRLAQLLHRHRQHWVSVQIHQADPAAPPPPKPPEPPEPAAPPAPPAPIPAA